MLEDDLFIKMGVLDEVTRDIRKSIRKNQLSNIQSEKTLVGIELEKDGSYGSRVNLVNSPDNIASFICMNTKDKLIITLNERIILNTMGDYVDLCADNDFMTQLLPAIGRARKIRREDINLLLAESK